MSELELLFKRDERVLRWLVTKIDKHAVDYAVSRIKRLKKNKEESKKLPDPGEIKKKLTKVKNKL